MALPLPKYTESEYAEMEVKADYRSEFYNGEIFAMAGGTFDHSKLATSIARCVGNQVGDRCHVLGPDMRIRVAATRLQTYPDVSVVCGDPIFTRGRNDCIENPIVIVEVLSESTESYDRGFKFDNNYKRIPSLREFVLVAQDRRPNIEVLRKGKAGRWTATITEGMDASFTLSSIGATIRIADVYAGIPMS